MAWDRSRETDRQVEAFEYYYGLGDGVRNLTKVANYMGKSTSCIKSWHDKFNWDERVEALKKASYDRLVESDNKRLLTEMEQYRKIIKASVTQYLTKLKKGDIQIKNPRDLAILIRLDLDLLVYIDKNTKGEDPADGNYVEFYFSDKETS